MTFSNQSPRPATLIVDTDVRGGPVGTVTPSTIPTGATVEVRFVVPAGSDWEIRVNGATLIMAEDIPPDAAGPMPFRIGVDARAGTYAAFDGPTPKGWFGQ